MTRRKNVILFMADQLRADHLGCYGNQVVRTPAIDRIAARGMRLNRFYVANPVCMPNRATIFTGRLPSVHGVRRNGIPLSLSERTFVHQLRDSGYRTALVGKAHFQAHGVFKRPKAGEAPPPEARAYPGWPERYFDEDITVWRESPEHHVEQPFYGFDHTELCLYHGDLVGGDYARWLHARDPKIERERGREHSLPDNRYVNREAWRTRVPEELYSSAYIAERTAAWLREHARQHADDPFFLLCSFPDPHHPFTPPGRFWDMYDPDRIELPPTFHQRSSYPPIEFIHDVTRRGGELPGHHHPFAPSEREAREAIALTYGLVSNMDQAIGQVLDAVDACGLAESTTLAFTSDHGDLMGDHGALLKAPFHFQGLIRVPFIWADPALPGQAGRSHDAVSGSIDIARTVLAHTGVAGYNGLQGCDLTPMLAGKAAPERAGIQIESETAQLALGRPGPYKLRSLVTEDWRITYSTDEALCEMYDLAADPHELRNLWCEPEHRAQRAALIEQLLGEMLRSAEQSPLPLSSG